MRWRRRLRRTRCTRRERWVTRWWYRSGRGSSYSSWGKYRCRKGCGGGFGTSKSRGRREEGIMPLGRLYRCSIGSILGCCSDSLGCCGGRNRDSRNCRGIGMNYAISQIKAPGTRRQIERPWTNARALSTSLPDSTCNTRRRAAKNSAP